MALISFLHHHQGHYGRIAHSTHSFSAKAVEDVIKLAPHSHYWGFSLVFEGWDDKNDVNWSWLLNIVYHARLKKRLFQITRSQWPSEMKH